MGLGGFIACRALSERNDDPARASRPFDKDRDGFVLSEGAGILVLEEYEHAKARGANDLRRGAAAAATRPTPTTSPPRTRTGIGAAEAMRAALRDAGWNPADVQYINAHGTSTDAGRRGRDEGGQAGVRRPRQEADDLQHQEHDRPPARGQRRGRGDRLRPEHQARRRSTRRSTCRTRTSTPAATSTTSRTRPARSGSARCSRTASASAGTTARWPSGRSDPV